MRQGADEFAGRFARQPRVGVQRDHVAHARPAPRYCRPTMRENASPAPPRSRRVQRPPACRACARGRSTRARASFHSARAVEQEEQIVVVLAGSVPARSAHCAAAVAARHAAARLRRRAGSGCVRVGRKSVSSAEPQAAWSRLARKRTSSASTRDVHRPYATGDERRHHHQGARVFRGECPSEKSIRGSGRGAHQQHRQPSWPARCASWLKPPPAPPASVRTSTQSLAPAAWALSTAGPRRGRASASPIRTQVDRSGMRPPIERAKRNPPRPQLR